MIQDAENRAFDLILTKEISRFARNTLDSIYYTRKLKDLGIGVIFLNDNINTLDPDSELRLTIMSSIAQEESRKTSDRVKWGQRRQMEKGTVFGNKILGYDLKDGKLSVNPQEAETVRLIFDLYLHRGMGTNSVSRELEFRGIPAPLGGDRWDNTSTLNILKNEKNIGLLKQRKLVTTNYLSHKRVRNPDNDYIIIENSHEPIIARATFEAVQSEIEHRKTVKMEKSRYSNRHVWSGKLICGLCNAKFKRKTRKPNKEIYIYWLCSTKVRYGKRKANPNGVIVGCDNAGVHEHFLNALIMDIIRNLPFERDNIITAVNAALYEVISIEPDENPQEAISAEIDKIEKQKKKLVELYYIDGITKEDFKSLTDEHNAKIKELYGQLKATKTNDRTARLKAIYSETEKIVDRFISKVEFSEEIAKQFLNKIVVYSRERLDVYINVTGEPPVNFMYPF